MLAGAQAPINSDGESAVVTKMNWGSISLPVQVPEHVPRYPGGLQHAPFITRLSSSFIQASFSTSLHLQERPAWAPGSRRHGCDLAVAQLDQVWSVTKH